MKRKEIRSHRSPAPIGPYSQAILVDGVLYVSGQIAYDANGKYHNQDIKTETHQVMRNIENILGEVALDFSHVVKCSIFVKNMDNFQQINEVYATYFSEVPPARETVEVSRLPKDVNVEISCIAVLPQKDFYMS